MSISIKSPISPHPLKEKKSGKEPVFQFSLLLKIYLLNYIIIYNYYILLYSFIMDEWLQRQPLEDQELL